MIHCLCISLFVPNPLHQQVGGWFDALVASPQYEALSAIQKDKAPGVVRFFAEYSFRYVGAAPAQWDRNVLAECCVEVLPRKMSAERAFFEAVAPVLSAFFASLAGKGPLARARELSQAVAALGDKIVAASQDERNWGSAKAFPAAQIDRLLAETPPNESARSPSPVSREAEVQQMAFGG